MRHSFSLLPLLIFGLSHCVSLVSWAQDGSLSAEFNSVRGDSKWGSSYFGFSSADAVAVNGGSPSIFTYNYLSANYKLSPSERISLRPAFGVTTTGYNSKGELQDQKVQLQDAFLNYSNRDFALLPGDWQVLAEFRMYFPTSESRQNQKTITYFRNKMIVENILARGWFANYTSELTYYVQSQKAYRNERTFPDGGRLITAEANQIGEMDHRFGIGRWINKVFTPKVDIGFIHEWYHSSDQVSRGSASRNRFKLSPNTEIHVTRDLWFILGSESKVDINESRYTSQWEDNRGQSIKLFHPENTQYYLMTFLSI